MQAREMMTENPACCTPNDTVQDAARKMIDMDCGCLPVVSDMGSKEIVVEAGRPVRIDFYRNETADCSEEIVFGDFGIRKRLPAFQTTPVEFTPDTPGEYVFTCGMGMLRGRLLVEAGSDGAPRD